MHAGCARARLGVRQAWCRVLVFSLYTRNSRAFEGDGHCCDFLRQTHTVVFLLLRPRLSILPFFFWHSTSGRLVGLLVCMALAAAMLFLPIFNIVAFEQMLYFAGESTVRRQEGMVTTGSIRMQDRRKEETAVCCGFGLCGTLPLLQFSLLMVRSRLHRPSSMFTLKFAQKCADACVCP